MALKIYNSTDGSTNTITDDELRQIEEHNRGKSLAEIAAGPPAFAHLAKRLDPRAPASLRGCGVLGRNLKRFLPRQRVAAQ